jgi:uncharacterized protein YecT (DUF1311 family)
MTARLLCDEFHLHRRVTSLTLPAWKRSEKAHATRQRDRGAMRRSFFAVPALAAISVLPAKAEMFGPGFQPCGEKTSTLEVVECVQAKTNASDQRLNAAYKALQARVDANQRQPLLAAQRLWVQYRDANCAFYGTGDGSIRQAQAADAYGR